LLTSLRRHCISRFSQWTGERLAGVDLQNFFCRTVRIIAVPERDILKVQLLQRQEEVIRLALRWDGKKKVVK